jgi:hypothetical protein
MGVKVKRLVVGGRKGWRQKSIFFFDHQQKQPPTTNPYKGYPFISGFGKVFVILFQSQDNHL